MRVAAILATKGSHVATIRPDAPVSELVGQLAALGIGALVVSSDGRRIEGIVSERDVVRTLAASQVDVGRLPVRLIMSTDVLTCRPEDNLDQLMATMTEHRVRHVPVVVDGQLCGIVSIGDVVKSRIDELERHRRELEEYITAR
jgi:CBS domain-containing protein